MKPTFEALAQEMLRLRNTVSLVELIQRDVPLTRQGDSQKWSGLCPFHKEQTPSFIVHRERNIFHCFGCSVGGDIFGWTMRFHKVSFPEAIEVLKREVKL